jgi:transcriptional regulator with PAS, ATPase and Fis domain
MSNHDWVYEFLGVVIVCDKEGVILEMNQRAELSYKEEGGKKLIGTNLLSCHPEPARSQLKKMLETQQANVYTIEKNGMKKLIYQTPWFTGGSYEGFVELSLEIPVQVPHFIRN